ncbi:MAG: chorismate mutase [Dehalococcoidia bacterium]|jgi:chorismate mutase|nr:chorismate mutase [Dehalococcoidia bacterium]
MLIRGIRGATTVTANTRDDILDAARELLDEIVTRNEVDRDNVASIIFSTTTDLDAEFPAVAARDAGFTHVALECLHEMNVPGSLPRCLRILMHVNSDRSQNEISHVYLRDAGALRPDLATGNATEATE